MKNKNPKQNIVSFKDVLQKANRSKAFRAAYAKELARLYLARKKVAGAHRSSS